MIERRVAVIGAGISGLVALKSCLEQGLNAVCFEQHGDVGGIWYTTEEFRPGQSARIYDSLILNTSKGMCCFSDFPFPEEAAPYPTGEDMHEYLKSYAEKFGLIKHIKLNTKVHEIKKSAKYVETGSWDVETEVDGIRTWTTFDNVAVCSGFYTNAYIPNIERLDAFKGSVEHSQTFKSGFKYNKKKILVVGNSNSAGDVAVEISRYAKQVILSVGQGTWLIPRCEAGGLPFDFNLRRIYHILPIAKFLGGWSMSRKANARLDHAKVQLHSKKLPPQGPYMVNDDIQVRIACGKVRIAGKLARFGETHAEFEDGTKVGDIDGVVFATGLSRQISFLDPALGASADKLEWYKNSFPIHLLHKTLCVIGYFRTAGSVVPIMELQARLAARVFAGKHRLPADEVMRRDIDKWNEYFLDNYGCYKYSFPNLPFRDELAEELGAKPSLLELLRIGPTVTFQYYFGPAFAAQHRLVGPDAWEGAVRACALAQQSGYAKQIRKPPTTQSSSDYTILICLVALFFAFLWVVFL